jgi:FkbH-like protein
MTLTSQLDWLPKPEESTLSQLEQLDPESLQIDYELVRFANHAWEEQQLRRLGRKAGLTFARANRTSVSPLPRVRLLIFSHSTFKHMVDTLVGAGLRCGIQIEPTIVEFQNPLQWLLSQQLNVKFDFVLFCSLVGKSQFADVTTGAGNAERTVQGAIAAKLADAKSCSEKLGAKIIIELQTENFLGPVSNSDTKLSDSQKRQLARFNEGLADGASREGYFILDTPLLASLVGYANWVDPRLFHFGKIPFRSEFAPMYLTRLANIMAAASGKSRRVMVTDLDNTLWGGVIGDDGPAGIVIGNGNPAGESFLAMQHYLLALKARGILLCIASKNTHDVAIEAFRNHPDVVLKETDFAAMRINWNDKAKSIREMAEVLNLGLEAFVFIDDNPAERKRVRDDLPQVAVPELDREPSRWPMQLSLAGYFEFASLTHEDLIRNAFYNAESRRLEIKKDAANEMQFLESLKMVMDIRRFDDTGRKRIVQLISKSNQFNLTSARYSDAEVASIQNDPDVISIQVRLADMFGDNGMISCVVGRINGRSLEIDLWIMSCRVIGRCVEQAILQYLVKEAKQLKLDWIEGEYRPTSRNALVKNHYSVLGFDLLSDDNGVTRWRISTKDFKATDLPFHDVTRG